MNIGGTEVLIPSVLKKNDSSLFFDNFYFLNIQKLQNTAKELTSPAAPAHFFVGSPGASYVLIKLIFD